MENPSHLLTPDSPEQAPPTEVPTTSEPTSDQSELATPLPEPHTTPEEAAQQMENIIEVLGAENVSSETQEQVTKTIAAENATSTETAPVLENFEEQAALYRRRITNFVDNATPILGRLRSLGSDINPKDVVNQPLQEYLERALPGARDIVRSMQDHLNELTPENLQNPQHLATFLETIETQKNHLLKYTQTCLESIKTMRKRAQNLPRVQIDADHELSRAARAMDALVVEVQNLRTNKLEA